MLSVMLTHTTTELLASLTRYVSCSKPRISKSVQTEKYYIAIGSVHRLPSPVSLNSDLHHPPSLLISVATLHVRYSLSLSSMVTVAVLRVRITSWSRVLSCTENTSSFSRIVSFIMGTLLHCKVTVG